ncbi:MAG: 1,4-dihydroxy-2-naphthoate octaprenyltransferase [Bacteroidales bacterium]|nr:1,4-dihydroxy-2-naphthoate octaprenyltransferase [Bacteroidales bacterium]
MRLRTLPLSLSGVILGAFLASDRVQTPWPVILFLLLTTVSLQILSNLCNELGDTLHGTDTEAREGIRYSLQDGELSIPDMRKLIAGAVCACCLSGVLLVGFSFRTLFALAPALMLLLGAAAIWAAMHYTLGERPYGYRGLGDLSVFLFFGLLSVCGGYFICTHTWDGGYPLLPACAIGCFSVAVLNVNNIRDMKSDAATRVTVAIRLGLTRARLYQTLLIAAGWTAMCAHTVLHGTGWPCWIFLLTLPLYALHLRGVWTRRDGALDPMLPLLVLGTFAFSLLAGLGRILA